MENLTRAALPGADPVAVPTATLRRDTTRQLGRIVLQRGVQALVVAALVGTVSFLMMRLLPGDMAFRIAAGRYGYDMVTAQAAEAVRMELDSACRGSRASWRGGGTCCGWTWASRR